MPGGTPLRYGIKVSQVAILKWIRKFSELIDAYAQTLTPQLSGVWNCDEMKTKIAHEEPINGERFYWLWNALDNGSRYIVASHLTRGRKKTDAHAFFEVAKKQSKRDPQVIFSDGLDSYRGAYEPVSIANVGKVVHIANVGIRSHMETTASNDSTTQCANARKSCDTSNGHNQPRRFSKASESTTIS